MQDGLAGAEGPCAGDPDTEARPWSERSADDWALVDTGEVSVLPLGEGPMALDADWRWDLSAGELRLGPRWSELVHGGGGAEFAGAEELLGRVSDADRERLLSAVNQALRDDTPVTVAVTVRSDEGREFSMSFALSSGRVDESRFVDGRLLEATPVSRLGELPARLDEGELPESGGERLFDRAMGSAGMALATIDVESGLLTHTASLERLASDWPDVVSWWDDVRERSLGEATETAGVEPGVRTIDVVAPNGRRRVFEISVAVGAEGGVLVVRDATEATTTSESLRESEERYALASAASHSALWDWDLASDEVFYSQRWAETLGLAPAEVPPTPDAWFGRVHPDDVEGLRAAIAQHLAGDTPHVEHEARVLHRSGDYRWVLTRGMALRDADGNAYRVAGSLSDVNDRKDAELRLQRDALYDPLTGLPNRALFVDLLGRAIQRHRRRPEAAFAVLFVDIDRFKLVNDSLGHSLGDELLRRFSSRLKECVRLGDTVARHGGDEFTVLLEECVDVEEASVVARRVQTALEVPFQLDGHGVFASASIGIAMSSREYEAPEDIIRDADTAMFRAKAMGKARHVVFDDVMHHKARSLLRLHTDLRHAVDRSELELQYQPIIDLGTGRLAGFEALVRWRHADRGLIWPDEFIPVAEENGLIDPISRWVAHEACRQLAEWSVGGELPPITVSVNLSSRTITDPSIVDTVRHILRDTGLSPTCLAIEVTETTLMHHSEVAEVLEALKGLGVRLYLDDFGTGYSSLSYLQRFDVDALKIDRSFVARMHTDDEPAEIVGAITSLAHSLGLQVIAEGIQTPAQFQRLRELGCDFGQGYMFSRPLDPAYAHALIVEDPIWE